MQNRLFVALFCGLTTLLLNAQSGPIEFNRDIRPILSDRCYPCHGPDAANRKTKLRFDVEAGARIELAQGRFAIVAGDPERSEMYRRVSSTNKSVRMPPAYLGAHPLPPRDVELIRQWIEQGAKWQNHWSFIPPSRPALSRVKDQAWVRNPIDAFVLQRLERDAMHPPPEASRSTLIRRVTLDLTGLPPSPAEVEAFLQDSSSDAYEKLVDRLLASPRYGERMAIRWLEAARYADTNGYQADGARDMWRWRDWVIDAFNRNMPFDRFTVEQIAGDLLPNPTLQQRIATAFNRNHRSNAEGGIVEEEFRVEYVADRAETTSTVWLGLTVGCARCHDHKFDPIPQADYYRMFAFFNNVPDRGLVYNFGNEEPLIKAPTSGQQRQLDEFDAKIAVAERRWQGLQPRIEKEQRTWEKTLRQAEPFSWTVPNGEVLHHPLDADQARGFDGKHFIEDPTSAVNFNYQDPYTLSVWINPQSAKGAILSKSEDYFEGQGYGLYLIDGRIRLHEIFRWTDYGLRIETADPIELNRWSHVLVTYDGKRKASGLHIYVDGKPRKLKVLFDELNYPLSTKEPFRIGAGGGLRFQGAIDDVRIYNRALSAEEAATVPMRETINALAAIPPLQRTQAQQDKLRFCYLNRFASSEVREAEGELADARAAREKFYNSIPTVMVMQEGPPRETHVLKRGAYDNPGEKVIAATPACLPPMHADWPDNRLGLARWLVDRSNPLTARVTVNRFWQMYFGTGLVKTVEDFGAQGEWPVNPGLLDWLATEFMDSGWDIKHIQKTIVMSATYRQSSQVTPDLLQKDPENRLLARGPRFRLSAEMIRDQALAVSGLLVEKIGGPSVKPYQPPGLWQELGGGRGYQEEKGDGLYRRSLYTYWKRTIAPPTMVNFDSPNRETCTVRQNRTDTPLQALDLMNDVTYVEAARKLAERLLLQGGTTPRDRIGYGYRLVLGRPPEARELELLLGALQRFQASFAPDASRSAEYLKAGASERNAGLDPAELAAYTAVSSLLLNLDETVTKD
jgi:hypothetical protein